MPTTNQNYFDYLTGAFVSNEAGKLTQIQTYMNNVGVAGVEATALLILQVFFPDPTEGVPAAYAARYGLRGAFYYQRDYEYQLRSKMTHLILLTQNI